MGLMIWGSNSGRARDLCPLQIVNTHFGAHPASCSLGTWIRSQGQNRQGTWLTSQLSCQVKNEWRAMSPLSMCLYGMYRANLSFFVFCFTCSWMW